MSDLPDVQPYLKSICDRYQQWSENYTPTDASGKQQPANKSQSPFDFGLMVQTVKKESREPEKEEKVERFPVLEGVRKYAKNHVLLVGRPGSGKSTALARLLLDEATQQTSIPVLVELRYWQGSIVDLICAALARHDLPLTAQDLEPALSRLAQGTTPKETLFLFDGVNELPSEEARSQLSAFRHNHLTLPMIFTTRDLSLGGDLGIEKKLEMQPLTETQMQAFIRSYVPEQAEEMLRQLNDRLREFGQTPLLLWMLCSLFQQTGQIPENLGLVFREFTQGYERYLKEDVRIESDRDWWKPVLQQLAWVMMQGEKPTEFRVAISREEAVRAIAQFLDGKVPYAEDFARKCLRDLQKHHLIQAGTNPEELEFRHQLIQEYYAAEALLEQLPKLDDEQLKREFLNYLKWTEPVALMLALIEMETQAVRAVNLTLEIDLQLGARLAGEVKHEFQKKTVEIVISLELPQWLRVTLWGTTRSSLVIPLLLAEPREEITNEISSEVFHALNKIDSAITNPECSEAINWYVEMNTDWWENQEPDSEEISRLLEVLENDDGSRAWEAAKELIRLNSGENTVDNPNGFKVSLVDVIPRLLKAIENRSLAIRVRAAWVLSNLEPTEAISEQSQALSTLTKALEDENYIVRWSVAETLGEMHSKEAIPNLIRALKDDYHDVRWRAAEALCKLGCSSEAAPTLLKALKDDDDLVSWRAGISLSKLGFVETIPILLKALRADPFRSESDVRKKTIEALKRFGAEVMPTLFGVLEDESRYLKQRPTWKPGNILDSREALSCAEDSNYITSLNVCKGVIEVLENFGTQSTPRLLEEVIDEKSHIRWQAAKALTRMNSAEVIPALLKIISEEDVYERWQAAEALRDLKCVEETIPTFLGLINEKGTQASIDAMNMLGSVKDDRVAYALPTLLNLIIMKSNKLAFRALLSIQSNCKYYNYEIYQAHLEAQKADRQISPNSDRSLTTTNNFPNATEVKIFENVGRYYETPPPLKDPPS